MFITSYGIELGRQIKISMNEHRTKIIETLKAQKP